MNRILFAAASAGAAWAMLACGRADSVRAQLVYDPFNYATSSALDARVNPIDGQPWSVMSNNGADDDIIVNSGSISYPGLATPPPGNSVGFSSTGKSERLGFDQTTRAGTLYYSTVFRVTSLGALTSSPVFIGGFSDRSGVSASPPTTVGSRLYLRQSASMFGADKFDIGVSKNSGFDIAWDEVNHYSLNTAIFVVGSYQVVGTGAGTDDVAKMWINPETSSLGVASAPTSSAVPTSPILNAPVAGTDLTVSGVPSLAGFVLRQGTGVPSVQLDELRIDTSWARVTPPTGTTWAVSQDGAWSDGSKWSTLVAPSSADAFVNFTGVLNAPHTVTVDSAIALRSATFDSVHAYTLAAGVGGSLNFSGSGGVNVRQGTQTINAPITLAGESLFSVATSATLNLNGDFAGGGSAFTKSGDGVLNMKHLRAGATNLIAGGIRITPNGGPDGSSQVSSIAVNSGAFIDLTNNDLVINYDAGPGSPIGTASGGVYSGVTGTIQAGRNGGAWNGSGIRTSQADAQSGLTSLGVGEASTLLGLSAGETALWSGQIVDDTSVLVRYTYAGDANLDGIISGDDYSAIDFNIATPGASGWTKGDFNYDGIISGDDYSVIDFNIVAQGAPLGDGAIASANGVTAVPEPASFIALATMTIAGGLLRRRRSVVQ